jgi:hypothetical protein
MNGVLQRFGLAGCWKKFCTGPTTMVGRYFEQAHRLIGRWEQRCILLRQDYSWLGLTLGVFEEDLAMREGTCSQKTIAIRGTK